MLEMPCKGWRRLETIFFSMWNGNDFGERLEASKVASATNSLQSSPKHEGRLILPRTLGEAWSAWSGNLFSPRLEASKDASRCIFPKARGESDQEFQDRLEASRMSQV
eukprot:gnl/MRDRNA2_/MRDRNA2_554003_c0_seq1.p1 gnl/MRDRNA2_/MRDRNA2_554003_c0~~gnl/MRDRNA2_/MRDRNA2_554003_c0_seq1.p1  ORF type:complete len:108 (+),score=12.03 gnl/MRDRNA2_/MRDRNA2_554003_c0_seq1:114-437(+)